MRTLDTLPRCAVSSEGGLRTKNKQSVCNTVSAKISSRLLASLDEVARAVTTIKFLPIYSCFFLNELHPILLLSF